MSGDVSVFEAGLGVSQGRIQPSGTSPGTGGGEYVFCLGSDVEGIEHDLDAGDLVEVTQTLSLTGLDLIRFGQVELRTPEDVEGAGLAWAVSTLLDGVEKATVLGWPGKTRTLTDLVLDVHDETGSHTIGVRLSLVVP